MSKKRKVLTSNAAIKKPSRSESRTQFGVKAITPLDVFIKLVFGSTRSPEQIAQKFGAEQGSDLEAFLIQLCECLRSDEKW